MNILQTCQDMVAVAIIRSSTSDSIKRYHFIHSRLMACIFIFGTICLGVFFLYEARQFRECLEVFYPLVTIVTCGIIYLVLVYNQSKIFQLIDKINKTIKIRSRGLGSKHIYVEANASIEKWSKIISLSSTKISCPLVMIPIMILSYYNYFVADLGRNSFYLPFLVWSPWDWKTPIGYYLTFMLELLCAIYVSILCATIDCYIFGWCCLMMALADDINRDLSIYNEIKPCRERSATLRKQFVKTIHFHAIAKQITNEFTDTCQLIYALYLIWAVIVICDILLLIQVELSDTNFTSFVLIRLFLEIFCTVFQIFIFCETSQQVGIHFEDIDFYNRCDWHLLPIDLQRMLPVVIVNTEPVVLKDYGNVLLTRDTFKKVTNGGFSYFMVLRQLGI